MRLEIEKRTFARMKKFVTNARESLHSTPTQWLTMTMTRITQLEDHGAAVAWSPVASHADFIVLGAKVGFESSF